MSGFYVTLISNVKYIDDTNTIGNFKTKLATKLIFETEWEVALVDIIYPRKWKNLLDPQSIKIMKIDGTFLKETRYIPSGFYDDLEYLLKVIHDNLAAIVLKEPGLNHSQVTPPTLTSNNNDVSISFGSTFKETEKLIPVIDDDLMEMLGFNMEYELHSYKYVTEQIKDIKQSGQEMYMMTSTQLKSEGYPDFTAGIDNIFLYSDVVEPNLVGDTYAQLLRVIPLMVTSVGEVQHHSIDHPFYVPVNMREVQIIEIDIKDKAGRTIKFKEGNVTVVLHFRRKNEFL